MTIVFFIFNLIFVMGTLNYLQSFAQRSALPSLIKFSLMFKSRNCSFNSKNKSLIFVIGSESVMSVFF